LHLILGEISNTDLCIRSPADMPVVRPHSWTTALPPSTMRAPIGPSVDKVAFSSQSSPGTWQLNKYKAQLNEFFKKRKNALHSWRTGIKCVLR
jgi:hypothetical protein